GCPVVDADLPGGGEKQGHGVIGDLVLAPVVGHIGDQDAAPRGRVYVDDVDAGAVPRDDLAAGKGVDRPGTHGGVLCDDRVRVPGGFDDIVLGLAVCSDQPEARVFDDRPFDVHITVVVVGDDHGLLHRVRHFLAPFTLRTAAFFLDKGTSIRSAAGDTRIQGEN